VNGLPRHRMTGTVRGAACPRQSSVPRARRWSERAIRLALPGICPTDQAACSGCRAKGLGLRSLLLEASGFAFELPSPESRWSGLVLDWQAFALESPSAEPRSSSLVPGLSGMALGAPGRVPRRPSRQGNSSQQRVRAGSFPARLPDHAARCVRSERAVRTGRCRRLQNRGRTEK
jgi:hypothetical protein